VATVGVSAERLLGADDTNTNKTVGNDAGRKTCNQWCQCYKPFFPSSLMRMPNKLERSSLETLYSQVLEFEGKARANPTGVPFR
jgi:hypothetical protein